jgi:Ser/Thr protein kinase RdoA (MazF antagonist)
MTTVWQPLNHDAILNAVEKVTGEKLSNLLLQRNSYINRVYELEEHDSRERFIVKFYRPDRWTKEMIYEEHKFLYELKDKEIPVIRPLQFEDRTLFDALEINFAIFPKMGGRALSEFDKDGWEEIGRLLARIHLVGELHKQSKRITWKPSIATKHHLEVLFETDYILPEFKKAMETVADLFIKKAEPLFKEQEFILLHGDCHRGNLIHRPGEGIFIVDFDDICTGPAVQDVWMLLPDTPEKCENELEWFLKGYETFRPFNKDAFKLIPALRGMRVIHFASWLAIQSKEPDFHKHFPKAGTKRYWNELIKDLQGIAYEGLWA